MKFLLLFLITTSVFSAEEKKEDRSRFENLELFNKVLYLVENKYYRHVDTEKLIEGAIKGMLSTLDPHTSYLNKDVFEKIKEDTKGEFGGVGIDVTQKDGILVVVTPIDDTPAYKAGIKSGDKIVEINHEPTIGLTLEEAVDRMRGKEGSVVKVGVVREGQEGIKTFEMKRAIIKTTAVKSYLVRENFGLIRLSQFQSRVGENVRSAIADLKTKAKKKGGLKGIILDLRWNPGGLLDEAVDVVSTFLNDGVVVSTEGRNPTHPNQKKIFYVKKNVTKELDLPLLVLINGASASASEIVSGALQDTKRAVIAGTRSFGKASVQDVMNIDNDRGLKLTIAQYLTPKGRRIQALGIEPDVVIRDVEGGWYEAHLKDDAFIRESDLRNHLTATVESEAEKKIREESERTQRERRIERIQARQSGEKEKKNEENREYDPDEDFVVYQAVNTLNSIDSLKGLLKSKP